MKAETSQKVVTISYRDMAYIIPRETEVGESEWN
jgi:hypothetical protein